MNPSSSKPTFRSVLIIGFGTAALFVLIILVILLDSIAHRELGFVWMQWVLWVPFWSFILVIFLYLLRNAVKSPHDIQPLSLGRRVIVSCLFALFLAGPVAGVVLTVDEIVTCRKVKARGLDVYAKVTDAELQYRFPGTRYTTIEKTENASALKFKLQFMAEGVTVNNDLTLSYLPNRSAIARVWSEAQKGTLKVRYLPGDPHTFVVDAAPCRESVFLPF